MQRALWSAASGMQAQQMQVDTIANNLANVNTNGFKRSRAEFQDLLYQTLAAPGGRTSTTTRAPSGIQLGLGTRTGAVKKVFSQGDLKRTEAPLDLAIQGDGFFKVLLPDGSIAYTRDGAFETNDEGTVVTSHGYALDPPVVIPPDSLGISVAADGTVSVRQQGQTEASEIGQIELAAFINPVGMQSLGQNLFQPSSSSGDPLEGSPGTDGMGTLEQGVLEISNVSIVTELVDLIAAQRAYELNSRSIQAADDMLQQVNNIIR